MCINVVFNCFNFGIRQYEYYLIIRKLNDKNFSLLLILINYNNYYTKDIFPHNSTHARFNYSPWYVYYFGSYIIIIYNNVPISNAWF